MKYNFLYTKSKHIVGLLDGTENPEDSLWFMSEEYSELIEKFASCSLEQYLVDLTEIFKNGKPDYSRLGAILGSDTVLNGDDFVISQVSRNARDVKQIVFNLIEDYLIKSATVRLYKSELPSLTLLKDDFNEKNDISYSEQVNALNINVNETNIIVASE